MSKVLPSIHILTSICSLRPVFGFILYVILGSYSLLNVVSPLPRSEYDHVHQISKSLERTFQVFGIST